MRNKIVSAAEAAALVRDGDVVATSGFVGIANQGGRLGGRNDLVAHVLSPDSCLV